MMIIFNSISGQYLESATQEHHVLVECRTVKGITKVVDDFYEKETRYILFEAPKGDSLRNSMVGMSINHLSESETRKCMILLFQIIKGLHDRRIKHGDISLNTVVTKRTRDGLEIRLRGFGLANIILEPVPEVKDEVYDDEEEIKEKKRITKNKVLSAFDQELAKQVDDDGYIELTEDIFDIGVLAFMLLNGIDNNPTANHTASQSLASLLSQSSAGRSVAEQTAEAFKTP